MMEKPTPPADGECCESACEPCVWDLYYEELRQWQEEQKQQKAAAEKAEATSESTSASSD
ncbi:oxidoreductase-like domain-containing protein [Marinobacterium sediminicola]|uniref:Oxidoreductase-like protein, N-terminal n=1 Tax=Marinobacterium sediminicola TaxID=518898 RepID=A0ABY1S0M9_9GAMM|nr:oxidoreductase-like domain-containing protein [Marinobacterium sediminicola]ULG68365.1 oxidoreductase-like domain-containing protein [Marinobacterium sediminicola]SMR74756.1 Oxidoreductase-like protein, N-terminal [Marinobacterium sediminicola]